ncbi:MAG TPA: DUF1553 domain-containing protein, partial [Planctomycetia bacterium]|nr:DUF1553 domain-containing protein [Planctomycetia bacterium]
PKTAQRKSYLLNKGNYLLKGDEVVAGVPAAFPPLPAGRAADRRALAEWLLDPRNPMTARVAVNRLWARVFGKGLVETEEDFGIQGEPPSHPELLDWLATEYRANGWDAKELLRRIVTSATYRQSSRTTPETIEKDPRNRWLARAPRQRLEAEMVRDQALALAGLLSPKIGGPSVFPPQPDGLWQAAFNGQRTWSTSMGEDRYRRAIYTFWRRTIPYPSMATFDAPSRETCTLRRSSTNTPLQAFVTLNDPVYVEAAQALARRLIREGGATTAKRAEFGLRLATLREPKPEQTAALVRLAETELERQRRDPAAARKLAAAAGAKDEEAAVAAAWTVVANALLNLDAVLTKG